jgi:hypothetical protein
LLEKKPNFLLHTWDLYPESKVSGEKTQLVTAYRRSLPRD